MNEREMTLGRDWRGEDLTGWLLSEKLDDVRCFCDGSTAWTRGGNVIDLPASIRDSLPKGHRLDGGIWAGRGNFTEARCAVQFNHWTPACRFICYDSPDTAGTWPQRMAEVSKHYHECVSFTVFKSVRHANAMLRDIQQTGLNMIGYPPPPPTMTRNLFTATPTNGGLLPYRLICN